MKFGVNSMIWSGEYDSQVRSVLPRIKEAGFDGVEIPLFRVEGFNAAAVRQDMEALGLELTVTSAFLSGLSPISENAAVRERAIEHLKKLIYTAAEAGSKILAGPMYSPVGYLPGRRRTADEWKYAVDGLQQLGDTLASNGVTLAIEPLNRFETYFLNTAADAVLLCDQVNHPKVAILFDTFHANIEEKDVAGGIRTAAKHLRHMHICENDRGTPGSGHVEWQSVFQALRDVRYDGWLTIESFGFSIGEISTAAAIWRDIETTPDTIAFDGIRFLRDNVRSH